MLGHTAFGALPWSCWLEWSRAQAALRLCCGQQSQVWPLTSNVLCHLGLIVVPQCPTHRCPVWCVGTKVLLAANSIFHLCTNTTNEDQPMVSKLFHARLAAVFQGCYLMVMCVALLIKCCLCFMEGWGFYVEAFLCKAGGTVNLKQLPWGQRPCSEFQQLLILICVL